MSTHVLKMIGLIERLEALGFKMDKDLSIDLVLQSLPESFKAFIMNFNMNQLERSLPDLLNMLRVAEKDLKKAKVASPVLLVGKTKKRKGKAKAFEINKTVPSKKQRKGQQKPASKEKDALCYACGKKGHWKRNCSIFLDKKKTEASTSGMFIIECNFSPDSSWILDSGCGSHICMNLQGLSNQRKLLPGEVDLRAANGAKIAALSVGSYSIKLPNNSFLVLYPCYYVPSCNKNIISVSCLTTDGYNICFSNKTCSIYLNDSLFACGELNNGLYTLNLSRPILSINKKRKADDSNLWHHCLSHINGKRLDKLAKEGLIDSFNADSLDT